MADPPAGPVVDALRLIYDTMRELRRLNTQQGEILDQAIVTLLPALTGEQFDGEVAP